MPLFLSSPFGKHSPWDVLGAPQPGFVWRRDKLLDEGFEKLCLICSSSPSTTGPRHSRCHRVEVLPPWAICLPAVLPVAPFSPCSILSTRTQSAEIPMDVGLLGTVVWSSDCQQGFLQPLLFNLIFTVLGRGQSFFLLSTQESLAEHQLETCLPKHPRLGGMKLTRECEVVSSGTGQLI